MSHSYTLTTPDPLQLINPRCKLDGATPVKRETKHIFLLLDKLEAEIKDWSRTASKEGKWSANGVSITESWLDKGLNPRGITRGMEMSNVILPNWLIHSTQT